MISNGAPTDSGRVQTQVELALALRETLPAAAFNASSSPSSWADPTCSILRDPRREDYTICTAVAPDAVFTVRTYATEEPYERRLVRNFRRTPTTNPQVTATPSKLNAGT